jgi:hypothetical protein
MIVQFSVLHVVALLSCHTVFKLEKVSRYYFTPFLQWF